MKKSFLSDLLSVGFSNIAIIVFGLGTSIITARYMGPEKNGIIAALLVYPSLFMTIGSMGIRQSTTYYLGKKVFSEDSIKTAITQIWFFTSVISLIVCFGLMYFFSKSGDNILWILLALAPIPFALFNTYNSGIFLGKNEIGAFNKINWLPSLIVFVFTFVLVVLLKLDVSGSMLAMLGGPLLMFFVLMFKNKFIQAFSLKVEWKVLKALLSLGIIYAVTLLVINLNYRIDIIILDKLSTPYQLGIYSKGAGLSQYLWQIPLVLSTIVFARSAVSKDNHLFSLKVAQLLRLSLVIVGGASVILYLFSGFIINLMYGKDFAGSIVLLKILLPGVLVMTIFKVMNMDLAGKGKPWIPMAAMIPALIINVILNVIFIPKYGAVAASWSSTVSYTVAGVAFTFLYSKETNISIREMFTYKRSDFDVITNIIKKIAKK